MNLIPMPKANHFLKKLITLSLIILVYIYFPIIPFRDLIIIPALLLAFGLISSKITGDTPKELYNFQRSEKFFTKGGLRDLIRVPIVLFAFIHDVIVWILWGVYQLFDMMVDLIALLKELIYWVFYAINWFLKLLVPFWRLAYKLFIFYLIKWPWWIYRYAFQSIKPTFSLNVFRISLPYSFVALLLIQLFLFVEFQLNIPGLRYIGIILAILPVTWVFGEIASMKARNLESAAYQEVKANFRNGLESVRGILFFLTFFIVLLLAGLGLTLLGWIPGHGILYQGFILNLVFILNMVLVFLGLVVVFGVLVLPSYRLYNEFSETSLKHFTGLLSHISKRILQYLAGIVPSSFFASIAVIPAVILIVISLNATLKMRDIITDVKIEHISSSPGGTSDRVIQLRTDNMKKTLESFKNFPSLVRDAVELRTDLERDLSNNSSEQQKRKSELELLRTETSAQISDLENQVSAELQKIAVNETRIEELQSLKEQLKLNLETNEKRILSELQVLSVAEEFLSLKSKQLPFLIYLGGLFIVVIITLAFTFVLGYFGNFLYYAFIFHNDGTQAEWKNYFQVEQQIDSKQPLLSTTLNVIILISIATLISRFWPLW